MRFLYRVLSFYPPFLGAGIRVRVDPRDPYTMTSAMSLWLYNRNVLGTHFGGSLYAMCDPFYALILLETLGNAYIVWDKSAYIDFVRPGRGTVRATFHIPREDVDDIRRRADEGEVIHPTFETDVVDSRGDVIAHVAKVLYVRRKKGSAS